MGSRAALTKIDKCHPLHDYGNARRFSPQPRSERRKDLPWHEASLGKTLLRAVMATIRWSNVTIASTGGLVCALAASVLVGWHSGNPLLTGIHPVFIPMQYPSAVGFVACGLGFAALALGWRR